MSENQQQTNTNNKADTPQNGIPLNFNPSRRVSVQTEDQWQNIPNRNMLGTTPGGNHLFGVTPGGTRIIYDRYYILSARDRGTKHTPDIELPIIEGVTCGNFENNLAANHEDELNEADEDKENIIHGEDHHNGHVMHANLQNGRRISDEAMERIEEEENVEHDIEDSEDEDMEF